MAYCDQRYLEAVVGGVRNLVALLDPERLQVADPQMVADALADGAAYINTKVMIKHDLRIIKPPYERTLIRGNGVLSAEWCHTYGGSGIEFPKHLAEEATRIRDWLEQVAEGTAGLGAAPQRALQQPAGVVDFDPTGSGVSVDGFKKGFR